MRDHQAIILLLEEYKTLSEKKSRKGVESVVSVIENFKPFQEKVKEKNRITTPNYNIFEILRIQFLETKVHTPFLTNLLDPNGSHAQSTLFLKSLILEVLNIDYNKLFAPFLSNVKVNSELKTKFGIIDILIYNNATSPNNRFAILIENKIFASDQKDQILRYYNYLKTYLNLNDDQFIIVYLTLNKRSPSSYSITTELQNDLFTKGILKPISYNPDIVDWLLSLAKEIESQQLKQTLIQYINILKNNSYAEYY